jgi:predicted RNA-binding Zn ribbon-like protein
LIFAHDTEVALQSAAALVNTDATDGELLGDVDALDEFIATWGWTGDRMRTPAELTSVQKLRPRLRHVWQVDEDEAVVIVNDMLRQAKALPQLVKHDGWDYHLHATPSDAPLATRMAVEAAMALVDVIRSKELSRLRVCDDPDCRDVFVDLSKNRSRRFCDRGCGNRANVAAYRARKAQTG